MYIASPVSKERSLSYETRAKLEKPKFEPPLPPGKLGSPNAGSTFPKKETISSSPDEKSFLHNFSTSGLKKHFSGSRGMASSMDSIKDRNSSASVTSITLEESDLKVVE